MHIDSNVAQKIKEGSPEKCDLRCNLKDEDGPGHGWGKGRGSSQAKGGGKGQEKNSAQEDRREICGLEEGTVATVWSKEGEGRLKMSVERAAGRAGPGHMGPCTMRRSLNSVLRATGNH